jgi:uncharacterized protein involved in exopolysaccharide biosynthesis
MTPADTTVSPLEEPALSIPDVTASVRAEEAEVLFLDLLIVLARRKSMILGITAGCAVLSIVVALLLPKSYTATLTILPPQQESSMGAALVSQLGSLGGMATLAGGSLGLKSPNDMYVAMFRSRTVEDAMVQHFNLKQEYHRRLESDARNTFEHMAAIDGDGKDGLIHISVQDRSPVRAAELANGYLDQFRTLSEHLAITEASQRRLFLQQQLEQTKDQLATAEEALKATEQKTGIIQLDSQARALIESAAALRAQIVAKEVEIESLRTYATSQNAQLIQAQQELEGLRAQLAKLGGSATGSDSGLMVPKGQVPEGSLAYARKLRDVKYYETIYEVLARQFEMAKLDEAREGSLIQAVDSAVPPDKRSSPKRTLIVIVATAAGFFFAVFLAIFQASLECTSRNSAIQKKIQDLRTVLFPRTRA